MDTRRAPVYARHRPEHTLLYPLVQEYYPALKTHLAAQGKALPGYVEQEFEDYLECGRLEQVSYGCAARPLMPIVSLSKASAITKVARRIAARER